jgi:hypothetical protein
MPSFRSEKNAKPWKTITAGAMARNEALRAAKYLGRTLWRRWSGYHRRSRVETKMHCMKLLGQRLMARDFDRQVAKLHVRSAILNGYTRSASQSRKPWDKSVRGRVTSAITQFVQKSPSRLHPFERLATA